MNALVFNKKCLLWTVVAALLVMGSILTYIFVYRHYEELKSTTTTTTAAVVSNGEGCAEVGMQIFKDGGCHVDAVIGTALCEGVIAPQSMGLGGGFVATIYTKGEVETLIARETAPAAATKDMFVGQGAVKGARSIGVLGELRGYWELHQRYGCLKWSRLFEPTIKLCNEGHIVSKHLAKVLRSTESDIRGEPSLSEIFLKANDTLYKEGEFIKRVKLGATMQKIAEKGVDELYNGGETGQMLVQDIRNEGGIITDEDLRNYKVRWQKSEAWATVNDFTVHTTPLPTSGPVLAFMLNVMSGLYTNDTFTYWHRVVETFKHAYGLRSNLGDAQMENDTKVKFAITDTFNKLTSFPFAESVRSLIDDRRTFTDPKYYGAHYAQEEDHGTANIAVLAPNGDAVVLTSTINSYFGSKKRSRQTGIILNDQVDDFSTAGITNNYGVRPSPTNAIHPGKIPVTSMCPSIILDNCGHVRMLVGAAGGIKITSAVATTIFKYLMLNETLDHAINDGRLHHQLVPMTIFSEVEVPENLRQHLIKIGHNLTISSADFSAVTAIGVRDDIPHPIYDLRRTGSRGIVRGNIDSRHCRSH